MKLLTQSFLIASIALSLILTGCASNPKPPLAQISLNVQDNINPYATRMSKSETNLSTTESTARPVVIRLYELTSLAAFNSTDFFSVFNDYKTALEGELLNSEEFRLIPGKKRKFKRTLQMDTRYVGVIAAFRDLEHAQWRASAAIPPKEKRPEIYILLDEKKIMIGAKKECSFFCRIWSPKPPVGTLYEMIEDGSD